MHGISSAFLRGLVVCLGVVKRYVLRLHDVFQSVQDVVVVQDFPENRVMVLQVVDSFHLDNLLIF